jgi:ABC-type transport system involved in cytochrome bd biosynthesis fused ATPase/permease subunit
VLLLGLSGWFITGAAPAGAGGIIAVQAFNYLLPGAAIRALAIISTVGRYDESLASHRAALLAMATLRTDLLRGSSLRRPAQCWRLAPATPQPGWSRMSTRSRI